METGLRDIREVEEAETAMLMEEELMLKRQEKVERLRLAWRKRMEHQRYERMMKELSNLSLEDLDKDMMTIERLVTMMMIGEAGTDTREQNIISMDDVEMCEAAKYNPNKPIIKWADELMDTVTLDAEGCMREEDGMTAQGDMEEDTLPEVAEMMPEGEGGMEVALSRIMGMESYEVGKCGGGRKIRTLSTPPR